MNKQIYTITEIAKELNQGRQNVRRRLLKLSIKAVNEHTREQNKMLSKLNENLLNQLDKNQTLLDQQQRLSLNDRNKIENLELEIKETKEESREVKIKWYDAFKKNKRE